jgi:hypothetical protein
MHPMTDYRGMTINERLYEAGLFGRWDEAVQKDDREAMVSMLCSVDLTEYQSQWTADVVCWNRFAERQRKLLDSMSVAEVADVYEGMFGRPADMSIGAANLKELILTEVRLSIAAVRTQRVPRD